MDQISTGNGLGLLSNRLDHLEETTGQLEPWAAYSVTAVSVVKVSAWLSS